MGLFRANAAEANENGLLLQITSPTANMNSQATPDCSAALLSVENAALSSAAFAQNPQQQTIQYCGVCSQNPCGGAEGYTSCGYDYSTFTVKRCDYYLGGRCSEDNQMICRCYSEQIP